MQFVMYTHFSELIKRHGLERATDFALSVGLNSVEFFDMATEGWQNTFSSPEEAELAGKYLRSRGISVACYSVGVTLYDFTRRTHSDSALDLLLKHTEMASRLGSPLFHHTLIVDLTLPQNAPTVEEVLPSVTNSAKIVADECKALGMTCVYENQGKYFNSPRNFELFFSQMQKSCDNVGVVGDVGNSLFVGESATEFFRKFAPFIKHVHLKDYLLSSSPSTTDGWTKTDRGYWLKATTIGNGVVELEEMMQILREAGYDGAFAFESVPLSQYESSIPKAMELIENLWK